jgi:hypothetical protein
LLFSCNVPRPARRLAEEKGEKLISWQTTPVQLRPSAGAVALCPANPVRLLVHGAHGCQCEAPQLLFSTARDGSTAACTSRSTSTIGRSMPIDVPYSTPEP